MVSVNCTGKFILADAHQRRGQAVNGVIRARAAAVAAGVARLDAEILIDLLAGLNAERHLLAVGVTQADAAFVQGELRIDPVLVLGHQPVGAIERSAGFLAAGQCQLQRPAKLGSGLLQTDERIREYRSLRLVVG